ncbi:hypothetical protein PLICRDRAFT_40685 [Plicaturopsis crispa FD-325 SS-3]|nr:hypothetical protein PLICRDRAFT_40685 [Plicaturopsis crispa FD-325 SS-3]
MGEIRRIVSLAVVAFFLIFVLTSGIRQHALPYLREVEDNVKIRFPDFSKYVPLRTLDAKEFPIDSEDGRVIIVGDVHGMAKQLQHLLSKLSYDRHRDTLIHVGDIVAKGSRKGSLETLSFMAEHNITGVRGNHDQMVIEWRAWMDWISSLSGGERFLREVNNADPELDMDEELEGPNAKWWKMIPEGWEVYGDHYKIARDLNSFQYQYLLSRPLKLHIPSAHAYIAHAGILSSDPQYDPSHHRQPLAHVPVIPVGSDKAERKKKEELLRTLQEEAILADVPQNLDPWVTLNMRGVLDHDVTRKKEGVRWSELWNADMDSCAGFDMHATDADELKKKKRPLPCRPATVIYGHAATWGLDVKRWSIGLDSGCVYNRRLTALVLGSDSKHPIDSDDDDTSDVKKSKHNRKIPFGDDYEGRLVSVRCK